MKRLNPWLLGALLTLPFFACLNGTEVDDGGSELTVPIDTNGNADTAGTGNPDTTVVPEDTTAVVSVAARINVPTDTTDHPGVRKIVLEMNSSVASDAVVRDTITLQAFVMELGYPDPIQLQENYDLKSGRSWSIIGKALDATGATDATVYTATTSVADVTVGGTPQFVLTFE